jgi:hypothetical protein
MEENEFKKLRHRFWKLGYKRRLKVLMDMGYSDPEVRKPFITPLEELPEGSKEETLENEVVQRRILFAVVETPALARLIELIEIQEEIAAAEEEKEDVSERGLRFTGGATDERKPSAEQLAQIKVYGRKPI